MTLAARYRSLALALVAVSLCSVVLMGMADTALHKAFWMDEGFEIALVCERPVPAMLVQGSFGCSPAPLFSAVERLVVRSVEPLGLSMRLTYRAVSLAAATLALVALLLGLQHRLGLTGALVAFATLAADEGFHHYAEQNRAYMTWLTSGVLLAVVTAEMCARVDMRLRNRLALLIAAGLLAGLSATPGCGQAAMAFAAFWVVQRWVWPTASLGRRATVALAVAALAIAALDVHYWSGSICRGWGGANALGLDLMAGSNRWATIQNAFSPLWPPGSGPRILVGHGLLLAGTLVPIRWWRRRQELTAAERYALGLWAVSISQLLVAVPVAVSLAASKYLYLPRMFIFLLAPRALLSALGFWLLLRALTQASRRPDLVRWVAWTAAAAIAAVALWRADRIGRSWHFPFPPVGDVPCAALKAPELRLHQPADSPDEFTLNFLVRLGRAFEACAATPAAPAPARHLLALDATNRADWLRVVDDVPGGFKPLRVCGEPVTLREGRFRPD